MSTTAKPDLAATITKSLAEIKETQTKQQQTIDGLMEKSRTPVYSEGNPNRLFHIAKGAIPGDSEGYSFFKAIALSRGLLSAENAKIEMDTHQKLKSWYNHEGFKAGDDRAVIVPFSTSHMPVPQSDAYARIREETRYRVKAYQGEFDPSEAAWVNRQMGGMFTKALGTVSDAAGGTLVGFPTLGELIDLQRNLEVFSNSGASEVGLPANGRIQFPKLTGGSTAYWVGEAAVITESTETTGYLDLQAKKLGLMVKINNELLRFTSPTTEGMVRMDMARQAALKADLAMLEGTGGTQIKGLITYPSASSWVQGQDKLLTYTVTSNLIQPEDANQMLETLPDMVPEATAFVMRKQLWGKLSTRRADAVSADDNAGPFVFNLTRTTGEKTEAALEGTKVVRSSQVSATRGSGAQTYVICGFFPDWLIGRFGIMEFLATGLGDTPFQYDQTWVRGIQHIDAGPRHASSFVFADAITIA